MQTPKKNGVNTNIDKCKRKKSSTYKHREIEMQEIAYIQFVCIQNANARKSEHKHRETQEIE